MSSFYPLGLTTYGKHMSLVHFIDTYPPGLKEYIGPISRACMFMTLREPKC